MPNKTIKDDVVKWFSKNKYNCKRNKGEHEYLEPTITFTPSVKYVYKTEDGGCLVSHKLDNRYKYLRTEISVGIEARCKHCGKKAVVFLSDKLN